ncbi:MAG: type II toxin-antitoxin system PemK/MazF family toxin [Spirochaetia bacterium]|jgi:mRNA interferase MazF
MKGEVVVVPFPFSDVSQAKNRPALVLIDLPGADAVLAAITSTRSEPNAIALEHKDFQQGALSHPAFIHPAKLFTFQKSLIRKVVGNVTEAKRKEVVAKIVSLLA